MSTETIRFSRRIVIIGLCVALLLTNALILAPVVGAASDTTKTETEISDNNNIVSASAEDKLLSQRANTIDEAKKEAQKVVSEQLAIQEAAKKAEDEKSTEGTSSETKSKETTSESGSKPASASSDSGSADTGKTSSSTSEANEEEYTENTVSASNSGEFLMDIDNPDSSYVGYSITLSDSDRNQVERMLMGEAGSMGFTGMALVAQCIRDTYVNGSYSSMQELFTDNGYYGSTSFTPSSTAEEVVNYIFDQGGSAVQHSIRVFYASDICTSSWHEAQDFVCSYGYVRFFDF